MCLKVGFQGRNLKDSQHCLMRCVRIKKMNVEFTASDVETAETLGHYLSSVFIEGREYTQSSGNRVDTDARFSRVDINREDVTEWLLTLQMDEAFGPDYIHPALLTNCAWIISSPLTLIPEVITGGKIIKRLETGKCDPDIQDVHAGRSF